MALPTATRERRLRRQGFRRIAGADEAGRGAWAGPLVAAAVILPETFRGAGLRDSKLLTARQRDTHYARICREALAWSVYVAPADAIDRNGIQRTNIHAIELAVAKLPIRPDYLLVDAWHLTIDLPHEGIIRGDRTVLSIAAASVIAKVTRDRLMQELHSFYPLYEFAEHKGYGTFRHRRLLARHGPSPIHRRSFRPMSEVAYDHITLPDPTPVS